MLLLSAAITGGAIAVRLKLPSIVGYIAGGILAGILIPGSIDHQFVSSIADVGVTLLLFTIGIEFSFHKLKKVLKSIMLPSIAQILLCICIFIALLLVLHIPYVAALYIASAMALSSTAIVVKLLSERGERETLPAEIATGWLIVQDLAVIPMIILLSAMSTVAHVWSIGFALAKAGLLIAVIMYLGRFGIPKLLNAVAGLRNRELFLLTVMGIVSLVGLATYTMGLSLALGAFLAGLLVSETSQNHAVFAEIRPLRDIFAVIFFVSLGMSLPTSTFINHWPEILLLSIVVLLIKGGIIFGLLRYLGYHRKNAMFVGLYLTQMSEFGFVLAKSGELAGALSQEHAALLVATTFVTIAISAPLITHAQIIYTRLQFIFKKVPKYFPEHNGGLADEKELPYVDHVVICGYGRIGRYIGRALAMSNIPFVVVDLNLATLRWLRDQGIETVYGDPSEKEILDYAQVDRARALVIAIPDRHTQEMVIAHAHSLNRRIKIICRTHYEEDQKHLKALGVQTIIQPEFEAALTIVNKLFMDFGIEDEERNGKITRLKIEHGAG